MADDVNSVYGNMAGINDATMKFGNNVLPQVLANATKGLLPFKKVTDEILKNVKETVKYFQQMGVISGAPGSGKLGMANMNVFSRGEKLGIAAVLGSAAIYDAMPSTAAAVAQRTAANTMIGLTGMGPRRLIGMANQGIGMGVTGAGDATMAAMALMYQGGINFTNPAIYGGVFGQIGGASAFSGMSNQEVATALTQVNSMNFLRTGTRVRDNKGNLLPINQIVNNLYRSMYSGRNITRDQAAYVYYPHSGDYRTIQQVAGGNEQLQTLLQTGIQFRAIAGRELSADDLRNPNKKGGVFDILGLPKGSAERQALKKAFAETNLLETSEKGLYSGYSKSLGAAATVTEQFDNLAQVLGPVYTQFTKLKGLLETFPGAGSVPGAISSLASTAAGFMIANRFMGGGGGGAGMFGGGGGGGGFFGGKGSFLRAGAYAAGAAALNYGGQYLYNKTEGKMSDAVRNRGLAAAKIGSYAATGAALGSFLPGPGTAIGATLGTIYGGFKYGNQLITGQGVGGESTGIGGDTDSSSGSKKLKLQSPVPPGTIVSSGFGPRGKAAAEAAKRGKRISSFHRGLDYAVPIGTKIFAAGEGTVTETGNHNDYGLYVIISHGPKSTLYGHLSRVYVRRGQQVSGGDVIALSGDTGNTDGAHLHFEVRNNGGVGAQGRQNPENFLTKAFKVGKNVVSAAKNIVTSGINMVKRTVNKLFGTNLTYSDVQSGSTKWDFSGQSGLGDELSTKNISEIIASAINTGSPLSYDSFKGYLGQFKSRVNIDGKESIARGRVNGVDNLVSGDSGTMAGGNRAGLIKMLYNAGFRGKGLETAFAVALAESGGRSRAHNFKGRDLSYGVFQINMNNNDPSSPNMGRNRLRQFGLQRNEQLYDPMTNIKAAYEISNGGKWWGQWGAYTNGSFVRYLDDARRAAKKAKIPVYHTGKDRVPEEQLALLDKDEMVIPPNLANQIRNNTSPTGGTTNINVRMEVNIARAGVAETERMFQEFKSKLERELHQKNMGVF